MTVAPWNASRANVNTFAGYDFGSKTGLGGK